MRVIETLYTDSFLVVGDMHLDSRNPSGRIDNYPETTLLKLGQLEQIAMQTGSNAIICLGDVFHRRSVSLSYLSSVASFFKRLQDKGISFYTVIGNHDIAYEQVESLDRYPLGVLMSSGVVHRLDELIVSSTDSSFSVGCVGAHYGEAFPMVSSPFASCHFVFAHCFVDGKEYPMVTVEQLQKSGFNCGFFGHYHGFEPARELSLLKDGEVMYIYRPGSLLREAGQEYHRVRDIVVYQVSLKDVSITPWAIERKKFEEVFALQLVVKDKGLEESVVDAFNRLADSFSGSVVGLESIGDMLNGLGVVPEVKERIRGYLVAEGFSV